MIKLTIPELGKRDFRTYIQQRFPGAKPRLGGFVLGDQFAGVIIRKSLRGINIMPTIPSLLGILLVLLGPGILAWLAVWQWRAYGHAKRVSERISTDFDAPIFIT